MEITDSKLRRKKGNSVVRTVYPTNRPFSKDVWVWCLSFSDVIFTRWCFPFPEMNKRVISGNACRDTKRTDSSSGSCIYNKVDLMFLPWAGSGTDMSRSTGNSRSRSVCAQLVNVKDFPQKYVGDRMQAYRMRRLLMSVTGEGILSETKRHCIWIKLLFYSDICGFFGV